MSYRIKNLSSIVNRLHRSTKDVIFQLNSKKSFSTSCLCNAGFARKLATGQLEMSWICPYPVLETDEELEELNQLADTVKKFFDEKVDSAKLDKQAEFDPDVLQGLKDLGLFGLQIPQEYGGLGLSNIKYARVLEEVSTDGAITVMLAAHQAIGLKGILLAGNDEQKKKYLPCLATGEWVAAFCLTEPSSGSDAASIQTKARLSDDKKHWILNGEKIWITNGGFADVMTVFAKTPIDLGEGKIVEKVTAFIVERSFGGITSGKPEDKLGIRASNTCSVSFEDTPVPIENVLGGVGTGFKLAMNILNSGRFSMGSSVAGQMKRMLSSVSEHVHTRTQFGKRLWEFGLIQDKIFDAVLKTYAMESMAYLTAGQMDKLGEGGEVPDCSIEAAMVKIYSSEAAWSCSSEFLQIFGGLGYMKDLPLERIVRDSRILLIFEFEHQLFHVMQAAAGEQLLGTNEILRLYVALSMLQYAGAQLQHRLQLMKSGDLLDKIRSFFELAGEWRKTGIKGNNFTSNPSFGLSGESGTKNWLHPALLESGEKIETSVSVFRKRIFVLLRKYGKTIQSEQLVLKTIADVATNIYAMSAVLARCNKSKILELRNADHELKIAEAFIKKTYNDNKLQLDLLEDDNINENDEERQIVCKDLQDERRYLCSHPLDVAHKYQENFHYVKELEKIKSAS